MKGLMCILNELSLEMRNGSFGEGKILITHRKEKLSWTRTTIWGNSALPAQGMYRRRILASEKLTRKNSHEKCVSSSLCLGPKLWEITQPWQVTWIDNACCSLTHSVIDKATMKRVFCVRWQKEEVFIGLMRDMRRNNRTTLTFELGRQLTGQVAWQLQALTLSCMAWSWERLRPFRQNTQLSIAQYPLPVEAERWQSWCKWRRKSVFTELDYLDTGWSWLSHQIWYFLHFDW